MIEGFYNIEIDKKIIADYFKQTTKILKLKAYGKPIIHSPAGKGKKENQGYDAFIPLIDSGISLYSWSSQKFLSVIIYTCKCFDNKKAVDFTKKFFKICKSVFKKF